MTLKRGERRPLHLDEIYDVLDGEWLYELLNGDDEWILQCLREAFDAAAHGRKYAEPCKYCAQDDPIPIVNGRHVLPGSVNVKCRQVQS